MNTTLNNLIRLQELTEQSEQNGHSAKLRKQIDALRAQLSENLLRRFDHLERHGRLAVARVSESGACGGCHIKLPPTDVLRIRSSGHALPVCPFCGCFLYWPAGVKDEQEITIVAS